MSVDEPFDPNKPFYLAATALAPGAPWPLGSNSRPARMRKYVVARQLDPCRRHHSVAASLDFGLPGIETTGHTDWAVYLNSSTPAAIVSACSRCGRMLGPLVAQPPSSAYDAFVQGKLNSLVTVPPPGIDNVPSFNPARWWFDARHRMDNRPRPLIEVVANESVPSGEIWVVGPAEKKDQPSMLEPRIFGKIVGIGNEGDCDG